jgi:hypothetical protein
MEKTSLDIKKAKEELKESPKIVRDYVFFLEKKLIEQKSLIQTITKELKIIINDFKEK